MPAEIEKAYINSFKAGIEQAFQQSTSRFRPYVKIVRQASEYDYYDRIGLADEMTEVTTRYGDNPMSEIPHDRRRVGLRDFESGKPIDEKDLVRVATDPTNDYTQAMVASANRKFDDRVISTLEATAYTGKAGETAISFTGTNSGNITVGPVSNQEGLITTAGRYTVGAAGTEGIDVAVNFNDTASPANAGLTLAKLKAARFTMMKLHACEQDEILNCFLATAQFKDLLGINEVINSDYATRKALAEGSVTTFMGFRFIHCERLPYAGGERTCYVFKPRAVLISLSQDIEANMWRLSGKKNIPYIYTKLGIGGSRMWGENLVKIRCTE